MSDNQEPFAMRRVLSIDEIHEKCQRDGTDMVISIDAPLVTALNSRSRKPLFGYAFTPRQIADLESTTVIGTTPDTDLEICRKVMHITGYTSLRFVHSTISKIRDIRRYVAEVGKYLMSRREKAVLEAYGQTNSLERIMEKYSLDGNFFDRRSIGVVDVEFFSSLDKWMIPEDYEEIDNSDPYGLGDYVIDTIYSVGNDRQIAECIADVVTPENCNDVAIVLDSGGSVAEAIKGALYRREIPFKNNLEVKDLGPIRDYLRFLDAALEFRNVRAGDVRDLFSAYGSRKGGLVQRTDGYLLCRIGPEHLGSEPDEVTLGLIGLMKRILDGKCTFLEVIDALPRKDGRSSVKILLRDMGIADEIVTRDRLTDMEYAINNVDDLKHNEQIPEDERRGVLLADCKNSFYIDRSIVIFVGLDDAWHNTPSGKDYIEDPQAFEEKEAKRLRILLQQGDKRLYLVRPATDGKETVPCQTFETISEIEGRPRRIESFRDICANVVQGSWHPEPVGSSLPNTTRECTPMPVEPVVFSKSKYNCWCDCPHKYLFKVVMGDDFTEEAQTLFGTYVHEFAEFCFCFPELAEQDFDKYVSGLLAQYSGISNTCMSELDASHFRTMMANVKSFIARIRPANLVLDGDNAARAHPNMLIMDDLRTGNRYSTLAEGRLESKEGHAFFARPDLLVDQGIFDYKTGVAHSFKDVTDAFDDDAKDPVEFQPLIYLKALQENRKDGRPIRFTLVYFGNHMAETVANAVVGDTDISANTRTLEVYFGSDDQFLVEMGIFDSVYDSIKDKPSYKKYVSNWNLLRTIIIEDVSEPGWTYDGVTNHIFNALGYNDVKSNRDAVKTFFNKFNKVLGSYRLIDDKIYVPVSHLEEFAIKLDEDALDAEHAMAIPLFSHIHDEVCCKYCDYRSACMSPLAADLIGGDKE